MKREKGVRIRLMDRWVRRLVNKSSLTPFFVLAAIPFALLSPTALFAQTPDPFVPDGWATIGGTAMPPGYVTPAGGSSTIDFLGHTASFSPGSLPQYDAIAWFPVVNPDGSPIQNPPGGPIPPGWEAIAGTMGACATLGNYGDATGWINILDITGNYFIFQTTWGRGCGTYYYPVFNEARHRKNDLNAPIFSLPAPAVVAAKGNPNPKDGDPVDLSTGLFVLDKTDIVLPDVLPIMLTRTYRTLDPAPRAFGIGATHAYDLYLQRNALCSEVRLILPDGGRIRYMRTSGTNCYDSTLTHTSTPTRFYQSTLVWNVTLQRWILKLKDGSIYRFIAPDLGTVPLPPATVAVPIPPPGAMVGEIQDRYGNLLNIARDSALRIRQITSPNGRWINFTYDSSNGSRISQVQDNIGRTVRYQYDVSGRLLQVTDPENGVTAYTYDAAHRLLTVTDARAITYLTNTYDATSGRVTDQVLADGTYHFGYTTDTNGNITQTDVTDPRGYVRRATFNSSGYTVTDTQALGQTEAQTLTYEWQSGTNLLLSVTDTLNAGRKTGYAYDAFGNVQQVTRLAGTAQSVTTSVTYEPMFNQLASMTDPLLHTTIYGYDTQGRLTSVTNALGKTWNVNPDSSGRPLSVTSPTPISATTRFGYSGGDLITVTDPLNRITTRAPDGAGRLVSLLDALGDQTRYQYDNLNRLMQIIDAENGLTRFGYDPNGNLTGVTDANTHTTSYQYDTMDRLQVRTDPLAKIERYSYDQSGNLTSFTDRKSQITNIDYDPLNRRKVVTYQGGSATTYTWDKGNRLTQVMDSISGTITRTYDDLDRLTAETTPQGSVSYTYDASGRRTSMTVAGQPSVIYIYDNANQLRTVTQGSAQVVLDYDEAGRRKSLSLPNGIAVFYGYDAASQLTSLTYKKGSTTLGDLAYTYDLAGNRTKVGGSWARTGLPQPVLSAGYDNANHQFLFAGTNLTYDFNGNLTTAQDSSGSATYGWDARNRLTSIMAPGLTAGFVYDALGRRTTKTINGSSTSFVYDGLNLVQEKAGASVTANILSGLGIDEYFTRTDSTGTQTFTTDALGSSVALTDNTGAVQTQYTYEPFGNTTVAGATSTNSFQYTGRENDGTALYYLRARYYSPRLQRFVSEDPIGFEGGDVNLYGYVLNSPTRFVDQLGLDWFRPPSDPYVVGRPGTLVEPGEGIGKFIEDYVPAMHTLGTFHDQLMDMGLAVGLPDWLINVPTMPGMYVIAVEAELYNSVYKIREKMRDRDRGLGRRK